MKKQKEKEEIEDVLKELYGDWAYTILTNEDFDRQFKSKKEAYLQGKKIMYQKFRALTGL